MSLAEILDTLPPDIVASTPSSINVDSASDPYIAYLDSDITALVPLLTSSPDYPVLAVALLAEYTAPTPETFQTAQNLLKAILKALLLDANPGALHSEETRLANLIFQFEDARLIISPKDNLPIFRPSSNDPVSRPSMFLALSEALVTAIRATPPATPPISARLFSSILGTGAEGEVTSLNAVANMSASVRATFDQTRAATLASFEAATDGTTVEDLTERKAQLEARYQDLEANAQEEEERQADAERNISNLNYVFKGLLEDSDLAEDLPDISAMLGGDASALTVEALFQSVIDQFNRKAEQEKAQSSAQSREDDLYTQYLRANTMLENNFADRDRATARIEDLNNRIKLATDAISNAQSEKSSTESSHTVAVADVAACDSLNGRYNSAQNFLDTAMSSSYLNTSAFSSLASIIPCSNLRSAVSAWVDSNKDLEWAQSSLDNSNHYLRVAKTNLESAYSSLLTAMAYTTSCQTIFDNTVEKTGSGKSEKTNPEHTRAENALNNAVREQVRIAQSIAPLPDILD